MTDPSSLPLEPASPSTFSISAMDDKQVSILEQKLECVQAEAAETQSKLDQITNILLQLVTTKSESAQSHTPTPHKLRTPR